MIPPLYLFLLNIMIKSKKTNFGFKKYIENGFKFQQPWLSLFICFINNIIKIIIMCCCFPSYHVHPRVYVQASPLH